MRSRALRRTVAALVALALAVVWQPTVADAAGDDYPHKGAANCAGQFGQYSWCVDENGDGRFTDPEQWSSRNFAYRNCTDWVAWRLNNTNGVAFHNNFGGRQWGNANTWDDTARALGYAVNSTPAVGAVAQTDAGGFGHVAWVRSVNAGGTVTVEDYNFAGTGVYAARTVAVGTYRYIHIKDLTAPPKPAWDAAFVDQSAYLDAGLSKPWDLTKAYPGQVGYLKFRARNTGTRTWSASGANPVRLGTTMPDNRSSGLVVNGEWLSKNRPTTVSPSSVPPGAVGTFTFKVRVPAGEGVLREHFRVLAEGASWMGPTMWRDFGRPAWSAEFIDQHAFTDAALSKPWTLTRVSPGQEGYLRFRVRNTGARTWSASGANPVRLGTTNPNDRSSAFAVPGWVAKHRPVAVSPSSVPPGAVGTFTFRVRVPAGEGTTRENFRVVAEKASWMGPTMWRDFTRVVK